MSHVASDVTLITGLVSVLDVNVCVPPTVTTLAVFVPAVVTLRSQVETVTIPVLCVNTASPLAKFITAPDARNRSENDNVVVPSAAPSFDIGTAVPVNHTCQFCDILNLSVSVCHPSADVENTILPGISLLPGVPSTSNAICAAVA